MAWWMSGSVSRSVLFYIGLLSRMNRFLEEKLWYCQRSASEKLKLWKDLYFVCLPFVFKVLWEAIKLKRNWHVFKFDIKIHQWGKSTKKNENLSQGQEGLFFSKTPIISKKKIKCNLSSCTIQQSFSFDCFPNTSLSNNLLPNTYFLSIEILHGLKIEDLKRLKGGP